MPLIRVVIAGTSGTGKSSLLVELGRRGHVVVQEPQRAVLTEQLAVDGPCLPSKSPRAFLEAVAARGSSDWKEAASGPVVFDRGLPDVLAYARRFDVDPELFRANVVAHPYDHVFLLEPWKEIFVKDAFRGLSFEAYQAFHSLIVEAYTELGYEPIGLPRASVSLRADLVEACLSNTDLTVDG